MSFDESHTEDQHGNSVQVVAREERWVPDWLNGERTSDRDTLALPVTLTDDLVPLTENGQYVPHHLDTSRTAHWFSIVEAGEGANPNGESYQMRYFRAAHDSNGQIIHDSYPVMPVNRRDWSPSPLPMLQMMLEDGDLENAQQAAYSTAQLQGLPFPDPIALGKLTAPLEIRDEANMRVEQFREHYADSSYQLLEPVDPTVNYSFEVIAVDPWTEELTADKWWFDENGRISRDSLILATYSTDWPEFEKHIEHERARLERETLHRANRDEGLEIAMRQAEQTAVANGELDPERADGRLFQEGPADRFMTRRQVELSSIQTQPTESCPLDITNDDATEVSAVEAEPGSWEELIRSTDVDEPEIERHYWQLHVRPAVTPDGTALGYALFCTEFPQLPPNFDEYVEEYGMDDSIYPTQARTVEIADFNTETEAKTFSNEFRRYLVPGVIDGPELAPDVARLEGLSGEWQGMDYQAIVDYMSGSRTVTREPDQWRLHQSDEEHELHDEMDDLRFDIDF